MPGVPSGLSGTAAFFPDILDLAQEAAERAGVDFTSGQALRSARMSLDLMSQEWANEGLNLWLVDQQVLPLVAGVSNYTLPADTMDIIYPMLRTVTTVTTDYPMTRMDVAGYAAIPNKAYSGRPSQLYISRLETPQIYVWPVPPTTPAYTLVYYRMRRIQDTGSATNSMDIPYRFVPAMVAGLAYKFALKSRDQVVMQRLPMLKDDYQEALMKAKYEDRDRSSVFLAPMVDY